MEGIAEEMRRGDRGQVEGIAEGMRRGCKGNSLEDEQRR
jgi:hypothetical protein